MEVLIGDANVADVLGSTGWGFISAPLLDGNTAWGVHTDDYVVPAGQTCTRFAFRAVSSVGGGSYGNFLDEVSFTTTAPPPDPTPTPEGSVAAVTPPPTDASISPEGPDDLGWLGAATVIMILAATGLAVGGIRRSRQRS